jgi:hypothetical protein
MRSMKKFDLKAYDVTETTQQEMLNRDGGNIFVDARNAICDAEKAVAEWVVEDYDYGHGHEI